VQTDTPARPSGGGRDLWSLAAGVLESRAAVWCVWALGVALRVAWASEVAPTVEHDAKWYWPHAVELATEGSLSVRGQPTAYWPVGYPFVLSLVLRLFGNSLEVARFFNVACGGLSLFCLHFVTRKVTGSRPTALLALLLYALYPADLAYTSMVLSESLFNAVMLASCALYLSELRHPWRLGLVGALCGVATLIRAHGLLLPLCLSLFGAGLPWRWRRSAVTSAGIMYLALALTMSPWWYRNAQAFGHFVWLSNNGGINLYIGNNPHSAGEYRFDRVVTKPLGRGGHAPSLVGGLREYEIDREAARLAKEFITSQPWEALSRVPRKLTALFENDRLSIDTTYCKTPRSCELKARLKPFVDPFYWTLAALALLGLVRGASEHGRSPRTKGPNPLWLGLVISAAFCMVQLLYFGGTRFHHPMMVWVTLYAAFALSWPLARSQASEATSSSS
jgi:4-amino-4-deoxy-L-arabinose transferase-like glycosyltransferase